MKNKKQTSKRIKNYVKRSKLIIPACFFFILVIGMLISFIIPLHPTTSVIEKRELAKFPKLTLSSFLDASFFKGVDAWFSDTFPLREGLISINNRLDELKGVGDKVLGLNDNNVAIPDTIPSATKPESTPSTSVEVEPTVPEQKDFVTQTLDSIILIGDTGYEYCSFNQSVADEYVSLINKTASSLKGISTVYDMLVPTSTDITMSDDVRKGVNTSNQEQGMQYIYDSFSADVNSVNIFKKLRMHRDEYIFYRTDHHWTSLGAFYAYEQYGQVRGFTPLALDKFTKESYGDFLGSFYGKSQSSAMKNNPDQLIAYKPPVNTNFKFTQNDGTVINWKLINNVSDYPISEKYSAFSGGDNPYAVVENTDKEKGSSCLVIKESFGNAFIPYLAKHYKYVYILDYRYYNGGIITFAKNHKVKDVLFVNNMSAVRSGNLIDRMNSITY